MRNFRLFTLGTFEIQKPWLIYYINIYKAFCNNLTVEFTLYRLHLFCIMIKTHFSLEIYLKVTTVIVHLPRISLPWVFSKENQLFLRWSMLDRKCFADVCYWTFWYRCAYCSNILVLFEGQVSFKQVDCSSVTTHDT